jgi:hypothetical protein
MMKKVSRRVQAEMGGGADDGWGKIMKLAKGVTLNLGQGFPDFVPSNVLFTFLRRPTTHIHVDLSQPHTHIHTTLINRNCERCCGKGIKKGG